MFSNFLIALSEFSTFIRDVTSRAATRVPGATVTRVYSRFFVCHLCDRHVIHFTFKRSLCCDLWFKMINRRLSWQLWWTFVGISFTSESDKNSKMCVCYLSNFCYLDNCYTIISNFCNVAIALFEAWPDAFFAAQTSTSWLPSFEPGPPSGAGRARPRLGPRLRRQTRQLQRLRSWFVTIFHKRPTIWYLHSTPRLKK